VTRTALATYDPTGGGSGVVAQTNVISFSLGNTPPGGAATLSTASYSGGNFIFAVSGTAGDSYIVQSTTNPATGSWTPVYTNTAPFNYTNTSVKLYSQQYFRAVAR
jgi:hypothetical protein